MVNDRRVVANAAVMRSYKKKKKIVIFEEYFLIRSRTYLNWSIFKLQNFRIFWPPWIIFWLISILKNSSSCLNINKGLSFAFSYSVISSFNKSSSSIFSISNYVIVIVHFDSSWIFDKSVYYTLVAVYIRYIIGNSFACLRLVLGITPLNKFKNVLVPVKKFSEKKPIDLLFLLKSKILTYYKNVVK